MSGKFGDVTVFCQTEATLTMLYFSINVADKILLSHEE